MNFVKKVFIGLAVIICFSYGPNIARAGFGISPPTILNQNLLPGSSYEQIIYIVRSEPNETLLAEVTIDAGNIGSWITIENGNKFEIPEGIQQFPMKVRVDVPADAQLGAYTGTIELLTSSIPSGVEQSAPVKVNLGAEIGIDLKITNTELVDYNIQGLSIKDTAKGSPIILAVKIQNRGNGLAGPTKVNVAFYDIYHNEKLWEGSRDISEKAGSFSIKDIGVELPNNLDLGQYWADVEFFDGEESINQNKIVFTIVEPSKISGTGIKSLIGAITKNPFLFFGGIAVFIILVLLFIWLIIRVYKKRSGK